MAYLIKPPAGARRNRKMVGRGISSRRGKTCGRGQKGQNSRSGGGVRLGFEGGQMPLYRRVARRGFSNYPFRRSVKIINLSIIEKNYQIDETVSPDSLYQRGIIAKDIGSVKILSNGELTKRVHIAGMSLSAAATRKIQEHGGSITDGTIAKPQGPAEE